MFLWENYLNEDKKLKDEKSENKDFNVEKIYKMLKDLKGIKTINIDNYHSMPMMMHDDGRKKLKINIEFEKDTDISEELAKIMEALPTIKIKIEHLSEGPENKNISLCLIKKFASERMENLKGIKIVRIGGE